MSDPDGRLRTLWGGDPWIVTRRGDLECWDDNWDDGKWEGNGDGAERFFRAAAEGSQCDRNWFEGVPGALGKWGPTDEDGDPKFEHPIAPALLGFDDAIDHYTGNTQGGMGHADAAVRKNVNILQLWNPATYNVCVNYFWLVCAAKGRLHGQGSNAMRFAVRPRDMNIAGRVLPGLDGEEPDDVTKKFLGGRDSYSLNGCDEADECYSSQDIFFLEVCVLNTICDNGAELFKLEIGQDFYCQLSDAGMERLKTWILARGK